MISSDRNQILPTQLKKARKIADLIYRFIETFADLSPEEYDRLLEIGYIHKEIDTCLHKELLQLASPERDIVRNTVSLTIRQAGLSLSVKLGATYRLSDPTRNDGGDNKPSSADSDIQVKSFAVARGI